MKASEIARLIDAELEGGADPEITGAAPLDRAGPHHLSLVAKPRYVSYVQASRAGLLLVTPDLRNRVPGDRPRIVTDAVHAALVKVLPRLYPEPEPAEVVHATASIAESARIEPGVAIGPFAVIGAETRIGPGTRIGAHVVVGEGCDVGEGVVLHAHVTLYRGVRIGARTIVHAGARLGVDGFGYAAVDGVARKVPQVGDCVIGSDVEIGANTTIDRGSIGSTEIGDHVKIDNLVHIGHNVRVGAGSTVVAQVGIAGSATIGRGVTLAGQAGIPGHIEIGDGATIAAQAGVFGDVPPGEVWSGYPARPHADALRAQAALFRLPKLVERVRKLERERQERRAEE